MIMMQKAVKGRGRLAPLALVDEVLNGNRRLS